MPFIREQNIIIMHDYHSCYPVPIEFIEAESRMNGKINQATIGCDKGVSPIQHHYFMRYFLIVNYTTHREHIHANLNSNTKIVIEEDEF